MKLRLNSCGVNDCPPNWHWITAKEGFSDYDLWVVFRGRGTIGPKNDPEHHIRVHEGAGLLLAPNTQYEGKHEPHQPLYTIHAHFDFLDEEGHVLHPRVQTAKSLSEPDHMKFLLMRMVTLFYGGKEKEALAYLGSALAELDISEPLTDSDADNFWPHIIYEICAEVDGGGKVPSLSELAEAYSYSERYIGKMFMKIRGMSYSEYTKNSRISRAKNLLRHTDAPLTAIAEETGYYDACHFSKAFSAAVGMSPTAYRKSL